MKKLTASENCIKLITTFEGLSLVAYKPKGESKDKPYLTIGYGHYGKDVKKGQKITAKKALQLLQKDLQKSIKAVNNKKYCPVFSQLNQNQFDALVSFTFNCGTGSLQTLCKGRNVKTIGNKLKLYVKSGGKTLNGLVRRRKAEQELFFKKC